jgi:hypothetical protein
MTKRDPSASLPPPEPTSPAVLKIIEQHQRDVAANASYRAARARADKKKAKDPG